MPSNALDVLESMKLFFDVPGFVFVVGLDQAIVERAVAYKYRMEPGRPDAELWVAQVSGTDYVKKDLPGALRASEYQYRPATGLSEDRGGQCRS
jgi:hypothetical protein